MFKFEEKVRITLDFMTTANYIAGLNWSLKKLQNILRENALDAEFANCGIRHHTILISSFFFKFGIRNSVILMRNFHVCGKV